MNPLKKTQKALRNSAALYRILYFSAVFNANSVASSTILLYATVIYTQKGNIN